MLKGIGAIFIFVIGTVLILLFAALYRVREQQRQISELGEED
jgi:hypothetical protein